MAVELTRKNWPDDRIDELSKRVGAGFAKVDERCKEVDERFKELDKKLDARFAKVDERFKEVDKRFDKARDELSEVSRHLGKKIDRLAYLLLAAALGYIATHGL